jgi:hypothetical protein
MNPELPLPVSRSEQQPSSPEQGRENLDSPETLGERVHETEQGTQQADHQAAPPPVVIPMPPAPVSLPVAPAKPADDAVGPTIAGDDDLIEKEWVDKAKKIIVDTQNDPYRREQEINKLQTDYLRKRYGKELGISN